MERLHEWDFSSRWSELPCQLARPGLNGVKEERVGGALMCWRGARLSTVWNNELMELGPHAGPLARPTGGISA